MNDASTVNQLRHRVAVHMMLHYRVHLDDLEIAVTPGYWRDKEPRMHPGHPLHCSLFNYGPFKATYTYFDSPRQKNGQFASRTRTWQRLLEASMKENS